MLHLYSIFMELSPQGYISLTGEKLSHHINTFCAF